MFVISCSVFRTIAEHLRYSIQIKYENPSLWLLQRNNNSLHTFQWNLCAENKQYEKLIIISNFGRQRGRCLYALRWNSVGKPYQWSAESFPRAHNNNNKNTEKVHTIFFTTILSLFVCVCVRFALKSLNLLIESSVFMRTISCMFHVVSSENGFDR